MQKYSKTISKPMTENEIITPSPTVGPWIVSTFLHDAPFALGSAIITLGCMPYSKLLTMDDVVRLSHVPRKTI